MFDALLAQPGVRRLRSLYRRHANPSGAALAAAIAAAAAAVLYALSDMSDLAGRRAAAEPAAFSRAFALATGDAAAAGAGGARVSRHTAGFPEHLAAQGADRAFAGVDAAAGRRQPAILRGEQNLAVQRRHAIGAGPVATGDARQRRCSAAAQRLSPGLARRASLPRRPAADKPARS